MTIEEQLRDTMALALQGAGIGVPVYSLKDGDLESKISEALASIGVAVLVRTPFPTEAETRSAIPVYTAWKCPVLTVETPMMNQGSPGAFAVARMVEGALQLWDPQIEEIQGNSPFRFLMRLDPSPPREDVSQGEMEIQLLSNFTFSKEYKQ